MKILRVLWLMIRKSAFLSTVVELAGAAAIVYGLYLAFGAPAAFISGGVAALLKAFELDLDRPEQGPGTEL